ncbi:hypothetical protein HG530_014458 [Fusarium avenaceum]|nr:hypothetical protein HG530_014458 [Fusarium avenaceum]
MLLFLLLTQLHQLLTNCWLFCLLLSKHRLDLDLCTWPTALLDKDVSERSKLGTILNTLFICKVHGLHDTSERSFSNKQNFFLVAFKKRNKGFRVEKTIPFNFQEWVGKGGSGTITASSGGASGLALCCSDGAETIPGKDTSRGVGGIVDVPAMLCAFGGIPLSGGRRGVTVPLTARREESSGNESVVFEMEFMLVLTPAALDWPCSRSLNAMEARVKGSVSEGAGDGMGGVTPPRRIFSLTKRSFRMLEQWS